MRKLMKFASVAMATVMMFSAVPFATANAAAKKPVNAVNVAKGVKLSWKKTAKAKKYTVYRSTKKKKGFKVISKVKNLTYTDKKAKAGKVYYYKVKASTGATYKVVKALRLKAPVLKTVKVTALGKVKLSWSKVAGAKQYKIYRATVSNGKTGKYKYSFTSKSTSAYDKKISASKFTYKYKLVALNGSFKSVMSNVKEVTYVKPDVTTPKETVRTEPTTVETKPTETDPVESTETKPTETDPVESTETKPTETDPVESTETKPVETDPVESTETKPTETDPAESTETKPTETDPVESTETKPIETDPVESTETKPTETDPVESTETKPTETETTEPTETETTVKEFTVTFQDYDGTVLKTDTVKEGSSATAPADPTRNGYTFTGWDQSFGNIISDMVIVAQYQKITKPTIVVSDVTTTAGATKVKVIVSLENNPGFLTMALKTIFDENVLTLTKVSNGADFIDYNFTAPKNKISGCKAAWYSTDLPEEILDGDIMTLQFTVNENAAPGKYSITVIPDEGSIVDENKESIEFSDAIGYIIVE